MSFPPPNPFPAPPSAQQRQALRRELRARRRALSSAQQGAAALALAQRLLRQAEVQRACNIAVYIAQDGEIDPAPLVRALRRRGKTLWLPVLQHFPCEHLVFSRWFTHTRWRRNRFAIPEPIARTRCAASMLDLILLPLVGFDAHGDRLGMGGGFYDRTLAFKRRHPARKPALLGLAHECQRVERLPAAFWDVPLRAIVTDRRRYQAC